MSNSQTISDIEKVYNLFKELEIGFVIEWHHEDFVIIDCCEGNKNIDGYFGFFTDFYFDLDGNFEYMGAWE